ncbi:cytochrome-c peroxidase [Pararobbsia silviterrae]|uniref:Cytochrome-c peroxidase n=2 Tax=Pararobbsia silviterrae TaxID=1792498 RepID=A0A494XPY5_9BURK|nr:cytochrome c peroxidase [Pararobbsia silviterrae]RKP49603.1 cytochrome-c peroxidase [Pararobbsia silviterrae]
MSLSPNAALPPRIPADDGLDPKQRRHAIRRALVALAIVILLGMLAFSAYALTFPERMPATIGLLVEDITGANPAPVHLERPPVAPLSALALLGKQIFFDASLSASGKQSCASCHSPNHSYGPPNGLSVQLGGPHMDQDGYRPPPSLAYLYRQAPFSIGPDANDADAAVNLNAEAAAAQGVPRAQKTAGAAPAAPAIVPQGGLFWDGRADTLQKQASGPMLNPVEMANKDTADVVDKLAHAKYRDMFEMLFGKQIFDTPNLLIDEAMSAVSRYQIEDPSFHAFTSKYDYWLEGRARMTQAEIHGMRLFNDPDKANCAGCHLSRVSPDGLPPVFTDTQYEALGVPRNRTLAQNKDPAFFDMGVCGPFRSDIATQTQFCGMFLTPTLRNSAERGVYFHNGVYHTLKQVMDFYNLRNTHPDAIYPRDANGKLQPYDDLPARYRANIDVADAPFDRKFGDPNAMSDQDIDDIIAFMKTLSDGYKVSAN